jgi:hypothetical protein
MAGSEMKKEYLDVVRLLVRVAPLIFAEPGFALKGGTAINLFVRDLPRLSVDLDLVFTDYQLDRTDSLAAISTAVGNMASRLVALGLQVHVPSRTEGEEAKLFIRQGRIEVKFEINQVVNQRGLMSACVALKDLADTIAQNVMCCVTVSRASKTTRPAHGFKRVLALPFGSVVLQEFRHRQPRLKLNSIHRHYTSPRLFVGGDFTVSQAHHMSLADVHC